MLPSLDYGDKRLGRLEEPFRVNFGLLIAAKVLSPRPLDVAGRERLEARRGPSHANDCRHASDTRRYFSGCRVISLASQVTWSGTS